MTLAGGLLLGRQTAVAYSPDDIREVQSAYRFRVWLRDTGRASARAGTESDLAGAIAARLLLSPVHVRREIAATMLGGEFFDGVAAGERQRQRLILAMEEGVGLALRSAPAAGDLWLAAAYLGSLQTGFTAAAKKALANSWLTTPRAAALAPVRAGFALSVASLLDEAGRAALERDLERVRVTNGPLYLALAGRTPAGSGAKRQ